MARFRLLRPGITGIAPASRSDGTGHQHRSLCFRSGIARSFAPSAPFCAECSALDLDVRTVDRRASCHYARVDQCGKQSHPKPPLQLAVEAIIDRCRRAVIRRTVAPPAADLEHVDNARNHSPIIDPPGTRLIPRQMRLDRLPYLVR